MHFTLWFGHEIIELQLITMTKNDDVIKIEFLVHQRCDDVKVISEREKKIETSGVFDFTIIKEWAALFIHKNMSDGGAEEILNFIYENDKEKKVLMALELARVCPSWKCLSHHQRVYHQYPLSCRLAHSRHRLSSSCSAHWRCLRCLTWSSRGCSASSPLLRAFVDERMRTIHERVALILCNIDSMSSVCKLTWANRATAIKMKTNRAISSFISSWELPLSDLTR